MRPEEEWLFQPTFSAPELLLELPPPEMMNINDVRAWVAEDGNRSFISTSAGTVSQHALKAADQYKKLFKIHKQFPRYVPFLLTLAECHLLMNDTFGALRLAAQAQSLLLQQQSNQQDDVLDNAVKMLTILVESEMDGDNDDDNSNDGDDDEDANVQVISYTRPVDWIASNDAPFDLDTVRKRWEMLQEIQDGAQQFARYAAVTTNVFELVFSLEGDSCLRLARYGLDTDSIEGISSDSKHKEPEEILSIIQNTYDCFHYMNQVIDGSTSEFDKEFVTGMHSRLLQDNNVDIHIDENGDTSAHLIPMGTYRGIPCFVDHKERHGYVVNFCRPRELDTEMQWFLDQTRAILSDTTTPDLEDPYRVCAWIQHAFVTIHPFGDGNGRVARLISSIPLMRQGLPPVYVGEKSREEYFAALTVATVTGDIDELACFLRDETVRAMDDLLQYNDDEQARKAVDP